MTPENIMGHGAKKLPAYDQALEERLGQSTFLTNAELSANQRLKTREHNLVRRLSGIYNPTNRDVLKLYLAGVEKAKGLTGGVLPGLGQKTLERLEDYLVQIGVLQTPYHQTTS